LRFRYNPVFEFNVRRRNMFLTSYKNTLISFLLLIAAVIVLSVFSNRVWGDKPEKIQIPDKLVIESGMTIGQFGQANSLSNPALKNIFDLKSKSDLDKKISDYGSPSEISSVVTKKIALTSEKASKNWHKIVVKFILWFAFLGFVFFYLKKRKLTSGKRKLLLFISLSVFGIIMGSDPGPMGTVKDAIFLWGSANAVFLPRMIALAVFLLIVFLANKYICAWGCQAGTLQDLVFRLNSTDKHKPIIGRHIKLPFAVTNTVRIIFFIAFFSCSFLWAYDIIEPIDIFRIYKPVHLGIIGAVFTGVVLVAGLFIYRPWCHLICPFGLVSWLIEKVSLNRITVDYDKCIACKKCADACPSTVMSAILYRDKITVPDCFSCYTCREVCPTGAIFFSAGKRTEPPEDHFKNQT